MKPMKTLHLGALSFCIIAASSFIFDAMHYGTTKEDPSSIFSKSVDALYTVSYVTSFWAKDVKGGLPNPHRREVEAALMANIHNPYFDQIVVFLDGVSEESNCMHFLQDMRDLDVSMGLNVLEQEDSIAKVTCVGVHGSQPPYYQMFMNAVSDIISGDVVIMANADQAFDYTISAAGNLNPDVLAVLATRGFSNDMPQITNYFYRTLVGTQYLGNIGQTVTGGHVGVNICGSNPYSWDTFIFHKNTLANRLKQDAFKRENMNNQMVFFYMNEMGAENAALWALQQSFPFKSLYNACDVIHSWHFHLTPKTHKEHESPWKKVEKSPYGSVPYPWGGYEPEIKCTGRKNRCRKSGHPKPSKNPPCTAENNCFLTDRENEIA